MLEEKKRTNLQNKAMHLWCEQLGNALNDAGYDMKVVLKPEADINWNRYMVKEYLWRPIQKAMLGKESTTELTTKELTDVSDIINRHLGEKFGISVPFPSDYERSLK